MKLGGFGFFVLVAVILCLLAVGVMLVKVCGTSCCRALIHVGWISYSWLIVVGFVLASLYISAVFAFEDFCLAEDKLITTSSISQVHIVAQSAQYFNDCLTPASNPTMSDNFQIDSALNTINSLYTQN